MKKTSVPNAITLFRIILSFGLLLTDFRSVLFILLYLICGLTDVLDGCIARKTNSETLLGARLDSLADFIMCCMIIIIMIKQIQITTLIAAVILIVFAIRIVNAVLSKIKFNNISSIHTIANKLTGLLLFFCPITYSFLGDYLIIMTGFFAILSSVEELLISLTSTTLDVNRKSIFLK
nr:CDP-alcohol phosphatidyltransferase family protein [uncultured Caproiciproducens sp.]